MKCPYARIETDRHGDEYVVCDKYDKIFTFNDTDDAYHIDTYCMGGEPCDKGIFDL